MAGLSDQDKKDLVQSVQDFPRALATAKADWAKYKLGLDRGLFSLGKTAEILEFYSEFPNYWSLVRPNFFQDKDGNPVPSYISNYGKSVDAWIKKLIAELTDYSVIYEKAQEAGGLSGLGLAPLLIAGVLVAAALGLAGAIWGISYIKKQANISKMIDETVAGKIPPDILAAAIKKEDSGFFGEISNLLKYGIIAAVLVVALPVVKGLFDAKK